MTNLVKDIIQDLIKQNDVVLFMKGTPEYPQCGFSGKVAQILDSLNISYKGINILEDDTLRQGIKEYSQWPTIPQLYVKGDFIGGYDIVCEIFQSKELHKILSVK
ncbi:Grx4 family monothiol glutaredoxin [Candidatus Liberibacter solanacearum]|uniref:Glutaredoxin n=1 Tax=Candidatus Liberibacter solanacearum TaxID=556287 RepID=A0A1V2N6S2_9HYPH|nr:Grx4 family monothiol glutaredoxin [Candidatus Liberibacter solanacearum]ONI58397.1 monothiol glutaredoxin, Grx4 family [Candidatus Liberibacter solanacearum]ONI59061.1 monothiol glutaredoxin, Grx4 family [Candidatus Liberibacter solanacearum]